MNPTTERERPPRPSRVIVIGAGIAGLAAARALSEHGVEVVVVEARDRVGGRIWSEGQVDLGAGWVHGTEGNPVITFARQEGLPTTFVGGDSTYTGGWDPLLLCGPDGKPLSRAEKEESILLADEVRDEVDALRREIAASGGADLSLEAAVERATAGRELTTRQRAHLRWHLTALARDDWAAGARLLSLLFWDEGYEVYGYGDSVFVEGMQTLTDALAQGLDVRLGHVVERIQHGDRRVRVSTSRAELEADAALVTLPLGVLKAGAVTFDPPLSDRKQSAIERLGMGSLVKLVLRFEEPAWPKNQYVFGYVSEHAEENPTTVVNLWKSHRLPALVMLFGGSRAAEMERGSDGDACAWGLAILRRLFGSSFPAPVASQLTRWTSDPFSRGAYAYIRVGSSPDDIAALGAPVDDTLFFAGEATARTHWACVHGAYVSGLREAARLTGDGSLLPTRHFTENRRWREMLQRADRFLNLVGRSVDAEEVERRVALLRGNAVFASVPIADLRVLATMFEPHHYADGQTLCVAGEPATCTYAVASGNVEVRLPRGDAAVATMGPGDVVGEYGMFWRGGRTATLVARGETTVLVLDYQRFKRFLMAFPESMHSLMSLTVDRLQELQSIPPARPS